MKNSNSQCKCPKIERKCYRHSDVSNFQIGVDFDKMPCSSECSCHPPLDAKVASKGSSSVSEECIKSKRVDGKKHSWKFDGDDPYIICVYCGEVRDALSGRTILPLKPQKAPEQPSVSEESLHKCCVHCKEPDAHAPHSKECPQEPSVSEVLGFPVKVDETLAPDEAYMSNGKQKIKLVPSKDCDPDCKERETCSKAGEIGHWSCGYCQKCKTARHHCEHWNHEKEPEKSEEKEGHRSFGYEKNNQT